jgi:hypothetical protein
MEGKKDLVITFALALSFATVLLGQAPTLQTSTSSFAPGLTNQSAVLFSDLLVHRMGSGLADNGSQGAAGLDEFRAAPLWGLVQRIFFLHLHDGRATPANGGLMKPFRSRPAAEQGPTKSSRCSTRLPRNNSGKS